MRSGVEASPKNDQLLGVVLFHDVVNEKGPFNDAALRGMSLPSKVHAPRSPATLRVALANQLTNRVSSLKKCCANG